MKANRAFAIVMACLICLASSTALASPTVATNPDFAAIDSYVKGQMQDIHLSKER